MRKFVVFVTSFVFLVLVFCRVNDADIVDNSKVRSKRSADDGVSEKALKRISRCRRYVYHTNFYCYGCESVTRCRTCGSCPTSYCRRRCYSEYPTSASAPYIVSTTTPTTTRRPCNCDPIGSQFSTCMPTGKCMCRPNYDGLKCDTCKVNYYKTKSECVECKCDKYGSVHEDCNKTTGMCECKPGVTGDKCDRCANHHYGSLKTGCKPCDPCNKPGHHCDSTTGKCVCPPLANGAKCEKCVENAWGFEPGLGCKKCLCSKTGSMYSQCDKDSGRCTCLPGYEGDKCDRCAAYGYYGYPKCKKCDCDPAGTLEKDCSGSKCSCNSDGSCRCKANVGGRTCNECLKNTFGLSKNLESGCTTCFCFGRSVKCENSNYRWSKERSSKIVLEDKNCHKNTPCATLPKEFLGDLTLSYGGYLTVSSTGNVNIFIENNVHSTDDNHIIRLETKTSVKEVQLNENYWKIAKDDFEKLPNECRYSITRGCLMVLLQSVSRIVVEPTDKDTKIHEVLLDKGENYLSHPSYTIEKCDCPPEYSGLSCQDPNIGYYRYLPRTSKNYVDIFVGVAKKCHCNGRSNQCHPETGHCINCKDHTYGKECEHCASGYYKDPASKKCQPCRCPTIEQNNAESCYIKNGGFQCECKTGYKKPRCDTCDDGYYKKDNKCLPCDCNPYGMKEKCDPSTGKCVCKEGFNGDKCSECVNPREYIQGGICVPCDECSQRLFMQIDELSAEVEDTLELFKEGLLPPWKILGEVIDKHKQLSQKFKLQKEKLDKLIKKNEITKYESKIEEIRKRLKIASAEYENNSKKIENISDNIDKEVDKMQRKLAKTIKDLNLFGTKDINVADALKRAQTILEDINTILRKFDKNNNDAIIKKCSNIKNEIDKVFSPRSEINPDKLRNMLDTLESNLEKLKYLTKTINKNADLAKLKNTKNSEAIEKLLDKINSINEDNLKIHQNLENTVKKLEASSNAINEVAAIYDELAKINFDKHFERLMKRDVGETNNELFSKVLHHVNKLEKNYTYYQSLFNFSNEEWSKINASAAYERLKENVYIAKNNSLKAEELLRRALQKMYPEDNDEMETQSRLALAYSDRLEKRIQNLKNISTNYKNKSNDIDKLKYWVKDHGKQNNNLNEMLQEMEATITSQETRVNDLENTIQDSENVSNMMSEVERKVNDMNISLKYDLFKKYEQYVNLLTTDDLQHFKNEGVEFNNITSTLTTFDYLRSFKIKKQNFTDISNFSNNIMKQIEELQSQIQVARDIANSMKIYLSFGNCSRTYRPMKTELFESLALSFTCEKCKVLKLRNSENGVVLDIEVDNTTLRINNETYKKAAGNGTTINITNYGSVLKLNILNSEEMYIPNNIKYVTRHDHIIVGDQSNKKGCMYNLKLNGKDIGLWNFWKTSGSCNNCNNTLISDLDIDNIENKENSFWSGGYGEYVANKADAHQWTFSFNFQTFDENSLLFYSQCKSCKHFMVLYLEDGYLNFIMKDSEYPNGNFALKLGKRKFNDGNKYIVEIKSEFRSGKQTFVLNCEEETDQTVLTISKQNLFRIKQAKFVVGGLDPLFHTNCSKEDFPITKSFLGLMKVNPPLSYGRLVGVFPKDELEFNKAWFNGNGSLDLNSPLVPINVSFYLRPNVTDGYVMEVEDLVQIYLENGKLVFTNRNKRYAFLQDKLNLVILSIKDNSLNVYVNGKTKNVGKLNKAPKKLKIKIGSDGKGQYFTGGISHIVVNNKNLIHFTPTTVTHHQNVQIGREVPMPEKDEDDTNDEKSETRSSSFANSMQNTDSCASSNYITEKDAVKFGDNPDHRSYIHIPKLRWKTNFTLEVQFRTFYPDGMILMGRGKKKNIVVDLKHGRLQFQVRKTGDFRNENSTIEKQVNDGEWHTLKLVHKIIRKRQSEFKVKVDETADKLIKIKGVNINKGIYLGNLPKDINTPFNDLLQFRGCIKYLKINGVADVLVKNTQQSNIRQCFPKVERGAHFAGDSYAVYKRNFRLNNHFELSFRFKTTEQNGILLSISEPSSGQSLSVELRSGSVITSAQTGLERPVEVRNPIESGFSLCDNRWHNVTVALVENSELTVIVDGVRAAWVWENTLDVKADLYIGGLPDQFSHGNSMRENFKGCISDMRIDPMPKDWSDMELINVSIDCPANV